MSRYGVALVGLLLSSCLGPGPRAPTQSGREWAELRSEHFTLVSDLDEQTATSVSGSFEETYAALASVLFRSYPVPEYHTNAVIFQSPQDLGEFLGDGFGGVYMPSLPNDVEPSPTLLASGTLSPFARLSFAHELTHRFNHSALGPMPIWLEEGLAEYHSTIRTESNEPVVGEIDPRFMCTPDGLGDLVCGQYEHLPGNRLPTASQLLALGREEFYETETLESGRASWEQKRGRSAHYGMAWLLVHLLMHGEQSYAQTFRATWIARPSPHKGAELAAIVQRVPSAKLDADLKAYLQKSIHWRQHHAPAPRSQPLARRSLSDAEVLVWWARLDSFRGKFAERAQQRLADAAKAKGNAEEQTGAPLFWSARYEQMHDNRAKAKQLYQQALNAQPDNPEYLYGLLSLEWATQNGVSWSDAARSQPVVDTIAALTSSARSPSQLNAVAAHQLFSGDIQAALATSARACASGPDCWACFHNHAAALFANGQTEAALAAERDALNRLSETAEARIVMLLASSVDYYNAALNRPESVQGKPAPGLLAP
jgi:tetratricopeptide (TPR) repeat protein